MSIAATRAQHIWLAYFLQVAFILPLSALEPLDLMHRPSLLELVAIV
jgi:hypothetical protein